MGTRTTCDGSGVEIAADTPTTGLHGKQYSEETRSLAEAYLAELDAIHTESATAFMAKLTELRAKYQGQLLELPDNAT